MKHNFEGALAAIIVLGFADVVQAATLRQTCQSSDLTAAYTVTCDQTIEWSFDALGQGATRGLQLASPPDQCARVSYRVTDASQAVLAETPFLNAGEAATVAIGKGYRHGKHSVQIGVIAQNDGCVSGTLPSWSVSVQDIIINQ